MPCDSRSLPRIRAGGFMAAALGTLVLLVACGGASGDSGATGVGDAGGDAAAPPLVFADGFSARDARDGAAPFDAAGGEDAPAGEDVARLDAAVAGDAPAPTDTAADTPPPPPDTGPADTGPAPPGPDHLSVGCATHDACPDDGADPGVCCTVPERFRSECSTLSVCGPGGRDACLTDEQCGARDPSRPVCCHDRARMNYCAPVIETCQPIEPCETWADCGQENRVCCSVHNWYRMRTCTSTFLANDLAADCPPGAGQR